MKKKIIYVFLLIFYLLLVCTVLSSFVEAQMYTRVVVGKTENSRCSIHCLQPDDNGIPFLFEVVPGNQWEKASCARKVLKSNYQVKETGILLSAGESDIIMYSSKPLSDGMPLILCSDTVAGMDMYLCIKEDEQTAFLFSAEGQETFFPQKVRAEASLSPLTKVYSLQASENFFEKLPLLSLLFLLLLFPVFLWIPLWKWIKHSRKTALFATAGGTILTLIGYFLLTKCISLPPAYLPTNNFFDFSHYSDFLTSFFDGLEKEASVTSLQALAHCKHCMGIALLIPLLGTALFIIFCFICKKIRQR